MATQTFKQPVHGNYHAYYAKRPNASSIDPRLFLLPKDIFNGKRVLDLGCNEGWLTVDIAQYFSPAKVVGVDLDGDLIRAAWKRRRLVWSLQAPSHKDRSTPVPAASDTDDGTTSIKKRKRELSRSAPGMEDAHFGVHAGSEPHCSPLYFPMAFQHMFGPLPVPSAASSPRWKSNAFPDNVIFYTSDWMTTSNDVDMGEEMSGGIEKEDREGYDVVVAFSLTKWIHLHGGDEGLLAFFRKIYIVLRSSPLRGGGLLLLEPQGWESYAKAKKLTPALSENYQTLRLRPSDFPRILQEIGFKEEESYAIGGEGGHKRSILVFRKT